MVSLVSKVLIDWLWKGLGLTVDPAQMMEYLEGFGGLYGGFRFLTRYATLHGGRVATSFPQRRT